MLAMIRNVEEQYISLSAFLDRMLAHDNVASILETPCAGGFRNDRCWGGDRRTPRVIDYLARAIFPRFLDANCRHARSVLRLYRMLLRRLCSSQQFLLIPPIIADNLDLIKTWTSRRDLYADIVVLASLAAHQGDRSAALVATMLAERGTDAAVSVCASEDLQTNASESPTIE